LIEFFRELFQPGETSFRQPVPVPFSAFRRERPARALGRPGRPDFLGVRLSACSARHLKAHAPAAKTPHTGIRRRPQPPPCVEHFSWRPARVEPRRAWFAGRS
jgi:hypothetical protein